MPTYDLPPLFSFDDPRVQKTISAITAKNIRVTAAHVSQSRTLHFIAEWYAARYDGSFAFMCQMRDLINSDRDLSVNQMAGVINCLVHDASKRKPAKIEELPADLPSVKPPVIDHAEADADYPLDPIGARRYNEDRYDHLLPGEQLGADTPLPLRETITPIVHNGTYTVVLNERGDYRTIKIEDCPEKFNKPAGTQIASYLSGSDNERDFTGCAFITGDQVVMWARFKADSISAQALKILVSATEDHRADYGTAYAIESGRCWKCGRKLTVPASLYRGMGPECSKKAG